MTTTYSVVVSYINEQPDLMRNKPNYVPDTNQHVDGIRDLHTAMCVVGRFIAETEKRPGWTDFASSPIDPDEIENSPVNLFAYHRDAMASVYIQIRSTVTSTDEDYLYQKLVDSCIPV